MLNLLSLRAHNRSRRWLSLAVVLWSATQLLPAAASSDKATQLEAKKFAAGELLPLRAIDSGMLPNSVSQKTAERQLLELAAPLQPSPAVRPADVDQLVRQSVSSSSVDTVITPDLQQLADSLNRDPLAIYRHFIQQYTFEPFYTGALKGAQETFFQKAGNDTDLASALITTLRAAGIQARYATATVRFDPTQVPGWIGTQDLTRAANILATAGYSPKLYRDAQKKPVALELKRVWVEFYQPATASWQSLDPSFKPHSLSRGSNLHQAAGSDPADLYRELDRNGLLNNPDMIAEPNLDLVDTVVDQHMSRTAEYLAGQPTLTPAQAINPRTVVVTTVNALPTTLPFTIQGTVSRFDELTDSQRQHIQVALPGFSHKISLPAVAAKRLTVDYVAATAADQSKIAAAGGILNVQYKGVNLKPQLRLAGTVIATGSAVSVGSYQVMKVTFWQGGSSKDSVSHNVTAGGIYAIALDTQKVGSEKLKRSAELLNQLKNTYQNNVLDEAFAGEYLHFLGMSYFRQLDNAIDNISASSNAVIFHQLSEALISIDLSARPNGQGQFLMSVGQRGIDAPRNIYSLFSANNDSSFNAAATLLTVGYAASALEHAVFEKTAGWPSVSTMSFLRFAANHEIPIYSITTANAATVLPQLDLPTELKNSLQQAVNAGRHVITPQRQLKVGKWLGLGYIVLDPTTGAAGFMINGGQAGGRQNFTPMDLPTTNRTLLQDVGYAISAIANGVLYGEFDKTAYDTSYASNLSQGAAFVSDLLVVGDLRNIGITMWDYTFNNGSGSSVALAAAGIVPIFDVSKKGYKIASSYFDNIGQSTSKQLYDNLGPDSSKALANLFKQSDNISSSSTRLGGQFNAVATTASRNGLNFNNIAVQDGQAYLRHLGIPTGQLDTPTKALLGEKAAIDYSTRQRGMSCYFCNGTPNQHGIDSIFKDAQGNFVITESKFIGTGSNFGVGSLAGSGANKQMTDTWLYGSQLNGSADSALARTPGMSKQQKDELLIAFKAGKVRKQVVVVTDQHRGIGVTDKLSKHPEFAGTAAKSKLDHIVIIELPIKP
ncbi:hypothetical protein A5320_01790 [Rheinheimera sp. SA_1]|uniref:transglutaminase domain-containing protein n=1 Tax=Rheinheimera sp. SA_1 TaxID=1827365 RepID=UPI0007FCA9E8|nr:transglutaminase domain-containing protein [Rheinheimera sp. SA_1]OBP16175.1 hypothetical protein A5320_01790 [Rheinheimera sp. SA_1]